MEKSIRSTFQVSYHYELKFTRGVFEIENPLFASVLRELKPGRPVKSLFVADQGVLENHRGLGAKIREYCRHYQKDLLFSGLLEIPGGEGAKNDPENVELVLSAINQHGICRHSVLVVVGGGAVIDMAGYAAAIAHRGIRLLRIPTTVLAQNDAAVGVKNGINYFGKKNFVGTFSVPLAIINDRDFLTTLEDRDWNSGMAEAVKVALIRDRDFFEYLENQSAALIRRDPDPMETLIFRCARLHMEHIAQGGDPFEKGSARPLDFGHWAAHKLEHLTDYSLRHGEAVAIGMALDSIYSHLLGLISGEEKERILALLKNLGFRNFLENPPYFPREMLLEGIEEFREHLGGTLTITLLKGIGQKTEVHQIDRGLMEQAMAELFPVLAD
ncbi:3-dehydroquinate synthase [Robiginitalea marina]|uniref:3-dehydroquinate synthase n=1 Tax=Robiginitalea marina TaxID=2954105 RepID=A0ABT1AUR7_9FLAO|nr:3-dehydroquinate synthase [Robiginitalea marina]MCO5723798.1 3-dehydroquinate synthase [Robiginitalea marina]